jgi:hypothetical protein
VTSGYRYLIVQFKRLAGPVLPEKSASRLNAIEVEIDNLASALDARAKLDALLPDIEASLENLDSAGIPVTTNRWIVEPAIVSRLATTKSAHVNVASLVRMCTEINSSYANRNLLATVLLMRAVLTHIPALFGYGSFAEVLANVGNGLDESFAHLETGLQRLAELHTDRRVGSSAVYPSVVQVDPLKPHFASIMQQVETRIRNDTASAAT